MPNPNPLPIPPKACFTIVIPSRLRQATLKEPLREYRRDAQLTTIIQGPVPTSRWWPASFEHPSFSRHMAPQARSGKESHGTVNSHVREKPFPIPRIPKFEAGHSGFLERVNWIRSVEIRSGKPCGNDAGPSIMTTWAVSSNPCSQQLQGWRLRIP